MKWLDDVNALVVFADATVGECHATTRSAVTVATWRVRKAS